MAMVRMDDSSLCLWWSRLTDQVGWLGLRVGSRLALYYYYIHQLNRLNS